MGRVAKLTVCIVFAVTLLMQSCAFADDIKTTPLKSFFSRFIKIDSEKSLVEKKEKITPIVKKDKKVKKNKSKKDIESMADGMSTPVLKAGVVFTIDDCVGFAIKNDPNIKKYASTQKAQKSAVGIAKSSYFPTLFANTGYNITNTRFSGDRDNSTNDNYYGINAGVNALIWDFGYTTAKINMNKYNWEAAGYDLETVTLNAIYTTKIDYTAVLAARANEDIYARSVRINQINVDRTRAMYEVGLKSKIDVVNAEATLTDAKINLIDAQNTYQAALITLNNDMYYIDAPDYSIKDTETFNFQKSYSARNEIDVAYDRKNLNEGNVEAELKDGAILTSGIEKRDILKTYSFKPFSLSMKETIQKAYENRPDLKALKLVQRASEEQLKMLKKSYYPEISANASYSMGSRNDYNSNAVGVFAGIGIPTVNAMTIKNQIEQGKSYLDIATTNVDLLHKNIYFQIQNYYINMKKLEKTIPLMSKKVEQTLENFELADGRYAVGLGNYIELQQAQTAYNNAQLSFVQSVFDYNQARFHLEKAMGIR